MEAGAARPPETPRRSVLRLGVALACFAAGGGAARAARPSPRTGEPIRPTSTPVGPPRPSLVNAAVMVAGPADAATGYWAGLLAPSLSQAMPPGTSLSVSAVGGRDGVTGANAFEALSNPDGSTALLVPGAAASAWLAGDPRVHFDAGRWVPALTSFGSAILVGGSGRAGSPLRVAASTPSGVEIAALLGLELLGREAVPVFGLADPVDARAALLEGRVDAVLLTGRDVPARAAALASGRQGPARQPIFSLGDGAGASIPQLGGGVPTLAELYRARRGRPPEGSLFDAWRATAAAARLDAALVLQPLTPAALVAQWRRACAHAVADPALASAASTAEVSPLPAPGCVAALSAMVADENTLLALRRWIASRTDWRPA